MRVARSRAVRCCRDDRIRDQCDFRIESIHWFNAKLLYFYSNLSDKRSIHPMQEPSMLAIRLPEELAILHHLDALEDLYLAEQVARRIENGEERTSTLDDVEARLGLAD